MKRLVFALLVLVVAIVAVGFYRSWFTVNEEKIREDEERAKQEVQELMKGAKAKTGNGTTEVKEGQ